MIRLIRDNIRGTVWKFYTFSFLTHITFFSAVLIPFFTQWGNISLFQVQLLQSWFMLCIFVLEVPTGAVADFFGRKASLILGCLLWIIGALVYGSFPNFYIFILGEFILAFGTALISGADSALLYDSLKELDRERESKKYFGRVHTMELIAMMVSAALGSLLAARFGVNSTMLLTSIPFSLAVLVIWTVKEPKTTSGSKKTRYLQLAKDSLQYFYTHKTLRLIALDAIIVASAAYFVIWLYQSLLTGLQVPIYYFGFAHAFLVGVQILISSNFIILEKIFGSGKNFLRFSAGVTAVTFILAAVWPNIYTVFLLLIFAGGFGLTRLQLMNAYMNRFIPSEKRATVLSSISMFRRLALVILNPIVGFSADQSLSAALILVGLLPLAVFFFSPIEQEMLAEN